MLKLAYQTHRQGQLSDEHPGFSMCVFVPDAHDGLPNLMDMMASRPNFLWDYMPREHVEVDDLRLPKFKLSFSSKINGDLEAMGIKAAFKKGTADFAVMLVDDENRLVGACFPQGGHQSE